MLGHTFPHVPRHMAGSVPMHTAHLLTDTAGLGPLHSTAAMAIPISPAFVRAAQDRGK